MQFHCFNVYTWTADYSEYLEYFWEMLGNNGGLYNEDFQNPSKHSLKFPKITKIPPVPRRDNVFLFFTDVILWW